MPNDRTRRPTHPGEILREDVLPGTGLTQGEFARWLGISLRTVTEILQGRRTVTADTAHRLARVLGTTPDVWLGLQQDVELWDALQINRREYDRIKPLDDA